MKKREWKGRWRKGKELRRSERKGRGQDKGSIKGKRKQEKIRDS